MVPLISATCSALSFPRLLSTPVFPGRAARSPVAHACLAFSRCDTHSRLRQSLLVLVPSLWLTCGRSDGAGPRNAMATRRWTVAILRRPSILRSTTGYPTLPIVGLSILLPTRISPRSDTSYRSNPATVAQRTAQLAHSCTRWARSNRAREREFMPRVRPDTRPALPHPPGQHRSTLQIPPHRGSRWSAGSWPSCRWA